MPGPSSIGRTCSRDTVELISACEPPRRITATSFDPVPWSVCCKPLAMARNDSSTMTTRAIATTVESDSQKRWGMLFRLISVTAPICSRSERISTASHGDCDLEPERVQRRHQPGGEAEQHHQGEPGQQDGG